MHSQPITRPSAPYGKPLSIFPVLLQYICQVYSSLEDQFCLLPTRPLRPGESLLFSEASLHTQSHPLRPGESLLSSEASHFIPEQYNPVLGRFTTPNKGLFIAGSFRPCSGTTKSAHGSTGCIIGIGDIRLRCRRRSGGLGYAILHDVFLDEELEENLFSYQVVLERVTKCGERKKMFG